VLRSYGKGAFRAGAHRSPDKDSDMNGQHFEQTLNPPSLAESITAKGFTAAAGFRIIAVGTGSAEVSLPRRPDLLQFFGHFHGGVITARWPIRQPGLRSPQACPAGGSGSRSSSR
jgi:hypothetical protein